MPSDKNSASVLVVSDGSDDGRLLTAYLISAGYEVLAARSYADTLELLERTPALAVLDATSPDLDAFEICQAIKADTRTRHLPVILVTTAGPIESVVEGREAGADEIVVAPFTRQEILLRVDALLRIHSLHGQLAETTLALNSAELRLRRLDGSKR